MTSVTFVGELAKLNEHDAANRANRFAGAALKQRMTEMISSQCYGLKPITTPIKPSFTWYYSSKHDFDNIAFAKKYVLDGMIKGGILQNDNPKWITGFGGENFVKVDKGKEAVTVSW